jgi:hypothetical protein
LWVQYTNIQVNAQDPEWSHVLHSAREMLAVMPVTGDKLQLWLYGKPQWSPFTTSVPVYLEGYRSKTKSSWPKDNKGGDREEISGLTHE